MSTTITIDQIQQLRNEAGEHGDLNMVAICDKAIDGDAASIDRCAEVIAEAEATDDSDEDDEQ